MAVWLDPPRALYEYVPHSIGCRSPFCGPSGLCLAVVFLLLVFRVGKDLQHSIKGGSALDKPGMIGEEVLFISSSRLSTLQPRSPSSPKLSFTVCFMFPFRTCIRRVADTVAHIPSTSCLSSMTNQSEKIDEATNITLKSRRHPTAWEERGEAMTGRILIIMW